MPAFQTPSLTVDGILVSTSGQIVAERVVIAAGAITVATTDYLVVVNKTVGAASAVALPASPATGTTFVIHDGKGDAATNNITITPNAGNINGAATLVLTVAYATATLVYNGTQWDAQISTAAGGGGAPTTSKYLLQVADGSLPNAQAMGALATGVVKNTTTTGVQSIATAGTDYTTPTGTEALNNKTITASTLDSSVVGGVTPAAITGTTVKATGILTTGSGQVVTERVVTAAGVVTVATTDYIVTVNKTVGAVTTVNLPGTPTTGTAFVIHDGKGDAATNNITITPAAGNINGAATLVLSTAYASAEIVYNGTQWDASVIAVGAGGGTVTSVTASAPIASSGGATPNISLTGLVPVANGGTNLATLTAHNLIAGNGTSNPAFIAPGSNGNFLVSNGTDFAGRTIVSADISTVLSSPPAIGNTTPNYIRGTQITATGSFSAGGGQFVFERVVTAAGAVTVVSTDYMVTVNKTVGAATVVNLPVVFGGDIYIIHDGKGDAATNNITITPNAGNINGAATLVLTTNYATAMIIYNGTQWDAMVISGLQATNYSFCQGRLTPTSGTPVLSADVTAAGTVYWTPYNGNQIGLYNGTTWDVLAYAETSLSLTGLVQNTMYDIFAYNNAGTLALEALAWNTPATGTITTPGITNASPPVVTSTAHGLAVDQIVTIAGVVGSTANNGTWRVSAVTANTFTLNTLAGAAPGAPGAWTSGGTWWRQDQTTLTRATALVYQNGILCKTGALTRRYLGTIRIQPTAAGLGGQTESSVLRRFVYNHYNQVDLATYQTDLTTHTYAVGTFRPWNNNLADKTECVMGDPESIFISITGFETSGAVLNNNAFTAVGVDSITVYSTQIGIVYVVSSSSAVQTFEASVTGTLLLGAGYHYVVAFEQASAGTGTFGSEKISTLYLG